VKLYLDTIADNTLKNVPHQIVETNDKGHGRVEARRYYITEAIDWLEGKKLWKNLKSIGMVESERSVNNITSIERRYFLTSLSENVDIFSNAVRVHWSIENNLHWVLDVAFGDDKSKTCAGDSAENLAIVRRIGYNVVKQDPKKRSIRGKRLDAGWDNDYLMTLLLKVFTF
jgi:predicted transposase YbfD/YdcC